MKNDVKNKRIYLFDEEGLRLLATKLVEVRKKQGFSQEKLAYDSGISLSQIARIETVKVNPSVSTIFKIARTMNVRVTDLFDFDLSKS